MPTIAVLFATREGHTRRIADYLVNRFRSRAVSAEALDVGELPEEFNLGQYAAVVLAAPVHLGEHEPQMVTFVRDNRDLLERMPSGFLSVSLSEAGAEGIARSAEQRQQAENDVRVQLDRFYQETGFSPTRELPVAGALAYTKYGAVVRLMMKQIAKQSGGPTDTSRDYEFTDWRGLDAFVDDMLRMLHPAAEAAPRP